MRLIACGLVLTVFAFPCWGATILVDQNGSGDFTNIQDAINYSWDGDTVLVRPGTYNQAIKFNGRRITLTSLNPDDDNIVKSTIITSTSAAVTFDFGEGSDSVITGFTILNGIGCSSAAPTIIKNRINGNGIGWCAGLISNNIIEGCNCGIVTNKGVIRNNVVVGSKGTQWTYSGVGIVLYTLDVAHQTVVVKNNIIANNTKCGLDVYTHNSDIICNNSNNCFWNNTYNYGEYATAGTGDFWRNPLFAIDGFWNGNVWVDGDYHLKSAAGRYDPAAGTWVLDDVNSPCIDKGDPNDPIATEPNPNGGRINIGAYGGTPQASKSPSGIVQTVCTAPIVGDLNGDCKVDYEDFAIIASHWLKCNLDPPSACW
jgi:hypothetical protein